MNSTLLNNRLIFGCACAFFVSVAAILGLRRLAKKVGLVDEPGGRKRHDGAVPLLGGIAIVLGTMAGLMIVPTTWPPQQTRAFVAAIGIIALAGMLDDLHEISAKAKLCFQFAVAAILTSWAGISLETLGSVLPGAARVNPGAWAIPFTILATVGLVNAVNMTDGLDGLVGGASLLSLVGMAWIASQSYPAQIYFGALIITAAALAGFLLFNWPHPLRPKRTFLGDTGSLVLGLVIAWFAVALSQRPVDAAPPIIFVWLCSLFLLDFICITFGRAIRGVSPLRADRRHLHHLLQRIGFSSRSTLYILIGIHAANGISAIVLWKIGFSEWSLFLLALLELVIFLAISITAPRWIKQFRRR